MWGTILYYPLLTLLIVGLLAIALGIVWNVLVQFENLDTFSLLSLITICVPGIPFILYRVSPRQRPGALLMLGGVVSVLVAGYPLELVEAQRAQGQRAEAAQSPQPTPSTGRAEAQVPEPPSVPQPPPALVAAPVPEMSGKPVDLSTVMGRAHALANAWQNEAALVGIEATQIKGSVIQTDAGGSAKVTFGPSPFATPTATGGSFVVTYDKTGLKSAASRDKPGKALVEPMCAPEAVYDAVAGSTGASLSLRYAADARQKAVWWVLDPAAAKAKPRVFDAQTCAPSPQRP